MGVRLPLPHDIDIDEENPRVIEHDGVPYGIFRVDGELRAFVLACSHKDRAILPLRLKKGCIVCPHHGATFDPKTGAVVDDNGHHVPEGLEPVELERSEGEGEGEGEGGLLTLHARKRHLKRLPKKERHHVHKELMKRARAQSIESSVDSSHGA